MSLLYKISTETPSKTVLQANQSSVYWAIAGSMLFGTVGLVLFLFTESDEVATGGHMAFIIFMVLGLVLFPLFMLSSQKVVMRQIVLNHQTQKVEFWHREGLDGVSLPYAVLDFFIEPKQYRNRQYYALSLQHKNANRWPLGEFNTEQEALDFQARLQQHWPAVLQPTSPLPSQNLQLSQKKPSLSIQGQSLTLTWRNNPWNLGVLIVFCFSFGLLGLGLYLGQKDNWSEAGPFLAIGGLFSTIAIVNLIKELLKSYRLVLDPEGLHYYENKKLEHTAPLASIAAIQFSGSQVEVHTQEQLERVTNFSPDNWGKIFSLLERPLNPLVILKMLHPLGMLHELKQMYQIGKGISVDGLSSELSNLLEGIENDWQMSIWDLTMVNSIRLELVVQRHLEQLRGQAPAQ